MLKPTEQLTIVLEALPDNAINVSLTFEDTTDDERGVLHWYAVTFDLAETRMVGGHWLGAMCEQMITVNDATRIANTRSYRQHFTLSCSVCGTYTVRPERLLNGDPICDVCMQDHIEFTGPTNPPTN